MKIVKEKYKKLDVIEKQKYIKLIKDKFEKVLAKKLELTRVSAPLLVTKESGLQDDLSGVERKVGFDIKKDGKILEVVQSLAKWKRYALDKYNFPMHKGLYTDMTAIRRDENIDEIHSIYVDQWDWEKVIDRSDRNIAYLKQIVNKIVGAICETNKFVQKNGFLGVNICKNVYFLTSQQLLDMYPNKTAKEREYLITKKYKTVFVMQIGDKLSDGSVHDNRAPDYDDWSLNGDLLVYHEVLDMALEISSMGIRVDSEAMLSQIKKSQSEERLQFDFHKRILNNDLPLSIGGGIGQSRLCMLLLGRAHIGEVQASYWDSENLDCCAKNGVELL